MVNLKNLLRKYFYNDEMTVYRPLNVSWGAKAAEMIYRKKPCHLAQYGKELSAHRDDVSQKITEDLRLNYSPEFEILENDVIEAVHKGQKFELVAGTAFKYDTHVELSVRRRKEATQK